MLEKITKVYLNDTENCHYTHMLNLLELKITDMEKKKKVFQHIGPQIEFVKLGGCRVNSLFFNHRSCYRIPGDFDLDEFIEMLSQTCTNIVNLEAEHSYNMSNEPVEQLIKSNKNLKGLVLSPELNFKFDFRKGLYWNYFNHEASFLQVLTIRIK